MSFCDLFPFTILKSLTVSHPDCLPLAMSSWTTCLTYLGLCLSIYKMEQHLVLLLFQAKPGVALPRACVHGSLLHAENHSASRLLGLSTPWSHISRSRTQQPFSSSTETPSLFQVKTSSERRPARLAWSPGKSWRAKGRQEGAALSEAL